MDRVSYGAEGQAYPVAPGTSWHCAGQTFHCRDINEYEPPAHDLLYCDPPWNDAMVKQFEDKAGIERSGRGYLDLYRAVVACALPDVPIWIEAGLKEAPTILSLLPADMYGGQIKIRYYGDRPCVLLYVAPRRPPEGLIDKLRGCLDDHAPRIVMAAYGAEQPPKRLRVVDPCAGRGLTARAAYLAGWESDNNELNPLRVSAALARMERLTGERPVRIT